MISDLKTYPTMKGSGVVWIGDVPDHWDVVPNRSLMNLRKELVGRASDNYLLLSLTKRGVIPRDMENPEGKFPTTFENYQVIEPGNLIFCLFDIDETPRAVGLSSLSGMITGAYTRFECFNPVTREYIYRFYLAMDNGKCLRPLYTGLRKVITKSTFLSAKMPLPSHDEQTSIVRYLNCMDRRIGNYIRDKQKLIKLLEEQKQAIIHCAVTRGLTPKVDFKSSGIEWLGDVPKHWEIKPLKRWVSINALTISDQTDENFEFRYIDIGSVKTGRLVQTPKKISFRNAPSRARRIVRRGDTIISTVRTYLKAVYFVDEDATNLIASTGFAVLSPKREVEPKYLNYVIQSENFINRISASSIGIAYPAIAETVLGRFPVALPPTVEEQLALVKYIETESAPFDIGIYETQRVIALLKEYRTRLIADVVTGKLDVREAAAHLPEEAEEPERIIDETDELVEADKDAESIDIDNESDEAAG